MRSRSIAAPERPPPGKWTVAVIVGMGVFMATLDASIVNISMPAIAHYFHVALSGPVEWVIIAYLLVISVLLLTFGSAADRLGHKPLWLLGLLGFTGGSALCGAAPSLGLLVLFRAVQGIGGALLMAISPTLLTEAFPPTERGLALGFNAIMVSLGVSIGPTLGGILTARLSWRAIFYVNLPIGALAALATAIVLRRTKPPAHRPFDAIAALLLGLGLGLVDLGLSLLRHWHLASWRFWLTIGGGLAALVLFVLHERRRLDPLLDLALFRDRVFASATASLVLSFIALFAVSFLCPFYLEELRGFSSEQAGLLLTPLPVTIAVVSPFSGALSDRIGSRLLCSVGLAFATAALLLLGSWNARSPVWAIESVLVCAGIGQALFQPPNNSALLGAAPRDRQGMASGVLATGRVAGQSLSVAVAGAVFGVLGGARAGRILASRTVEAARPALERTFLHAYHAAFYVCAAIAAIGVFTSLVRPSRP